MKVVSKFGEPIPSVRVTCKNEDCKALLELEANDLVKKISLNVDCPLTYFVFTCPLCGERIRLYEDELPKSFRDLIKAQ